MLSFIHMGNRKKRARARKSRPPGSTTSSSPRRRSNRGSVSFVSAGDAGVLVTKRASFNRGMARDVSPADSTKAVVGRELQRSLNEDRSPAIQLDFKHDSLLNSLPCRYLQDGKSSTENSGSEYSQATKSTHSVVRRMEKQKYTAPAVSHYQPRPLPDPTKHRPFPLTVAPIQIPLTSTKSEVIDLPRTRQAETLSQAWASDTELSPISGASEARNVLSNAIAFTSRTPAPSVLSNTGQDQEQEREKLRVQRQDSATIPRELVWEYVPRSNPVSRKSSARSMKKRKYDHGSLELPPLPLEALPSLSFLEEDPLGVGKEEPPLTPPPRTDSMQTTSLTPSGSAEVSQRFQSARHEQETVMASNTNPVEHGHALTFPLTPPLTGSTTASGSTPSKYSTLVDSPSISDLFVQPSAATSFDHSFESDVKGQNVSCALLSPVLNEDRAAHSSQLSHTGHQVMDPSSLQRRASLILPHVAPLCISRTRTQRKEHISQEPSVEGSAPPVSNTLPVPDEGSSKGKVAQPDRGKTVYANERENPREVRISTVSTNQTSQPEVASPDSCYSPDLLDMLIPDASIIPSISHHHTSRNKHSAPRPIYISPQKSSRYRLAAEDALSPFQEHLQPDSGTSCEFSGRTQTFPETPVFSPEILTESLPTSSRNSMAWSVPAALTSGSTQPRIGSSLAQNLSFSRTSVIPEVSEPPSSPSSIRQTPGSGSIKLPNIQSPVESPPISPLGPPPKCASPLPQPSRDSFSSIPSSSSRRKTIHLRPPLPFGPRKREASFSSPKVPKHSSSVSPLSLSDNRDRGSLDSLASNVVRNNPDSLQSSPKPQPGPQFQTTPIPWRGYPLDAAKWTFTSAELQDIVRDAIVSTSRSSSIRLLHPDVLKEEIPTVLSRLSLRKEEIRKEYRTLVRRRQSLIQRLLSLSSMPPLRASQSNMTTLIQELAGVDAACDGLTEELHDLDNQITQITHLQDVHQISALAMALRKLNFSFFRRTNEILALKSEVANLFAERQEAWRKAEELEQELESALEGREQRPKTMSEANSRRSSRVSVARRNSQRASEAGLRLSGHSFRRRSQVSNWTHSDVLDSERSTFSSDDVPPVPPLPPSSADAIGDHENVSGSRSSRPLTPGSPTTEALYRALYDLLNVNKSDRHPYSLSRSRPQSEIAPSDCGMQQLQQDLHAHLRSASVPNVAEKNISDAKDQSGPIMAAIGLERNPGPSSRF